MNNFRTIKTSTLNIIDPSQITTGSFSDDTGATINYWKTGNLYFGFYITGIGYGTTGIFNPGTGTDSSDRIALKLGTTVNTVYVENFNTGETLSYWDIGSSRWMNATLTNDDLIYAILAN